MSDGRHRLVMEFRTTTKRRECQKPDRQGGPVTQVALPDGRASDTTRDVISWIDFQPNREPLAIQRDLKPNARGARKKKVREWQLAPENGRVNYPRTPANT